MRLPFLDRAQEAARLRKLLNSGEGALGVLYGRRRCGKSRLVREVLPPGRSVYYVADDREAVLQRAALAAEISAVIPGFDGVVYPQWETLLDRFWQAAPGGAVLALDEFPSLVSAAPELPSLLQKRIDRGGMNAVHLVLAGSSQQMMQGLILDRTAPLYGRAREVLKIEPLPAGWISRVLGGADPVRAVESFAVWGGLPRYWELAADYPDLWSAVRELALSPLGVLHDEPARLLRDDLRDTVQAVSILSLIGNGCGRPSEIAARLGKPATSLARPLQRLTELDLVRREVPFGAHPRDGKRVLYSIADPFLRFWFRFVEPNRSRLEANLINRVMTDVQRGFPAHAGPVWEELARASVPRLRLFGREWGPASRWWGAGLDRTPMELDLVAESAERDALLVGEARWSGSENSRRVLAELSRKAANLAEARGRPVFCAVWLRDPSAGRGQKGICTPAQVLRALRGSA